MKTWNDYKEYVKSVDDKSRRQMEEIEEISVIVGAIIEQRQALGLSQRELALRCGIPQSSVARIATLKTVPNLGLRLTVSHSEQF